MCVCVFTVDHRVPVDVVRKVDTKLVVGSEAGMAIPTTSRHVQMERGPMQRLTTTVQIFRKDWSIDDGSTRTEGVHRAKRREEKQ